VKVNEMSVPAAADAHEFVVAPELAEVAAIYHVTQATASGSKSSMATQTRTFRHGASHGRQRGSDPSSPTTNTWASAPAQSCGRSPAISDPDRHRPDRGRSNQARPTPRRLSGRAERAS
jgi:hypothetical protein